MEHTPVPWELSGNTIYDHEGKGVAQSAWEIMAEFSTGDHAIFLKRSEKDEEVARANAEYIVRACNSHDGLLKAAKAVILKFECCDGTTPLAALETAIAKAEKEI